MPNNHRKRYTVLAIDDDAWTRNILRSTLREFADINFLDAKDPEHALTAVEREKPDIVYLDINLGGDQDGIALLKQLRQAAPEIFIVMVTAHGTAENLKKAMELGIGGFVVKPFTGEKIAATLKKFESVSAKQ